MSKPRSTPPITSVSNSRVQWLRSLKERRGREAAGAFLVEGPHAIEQALHADVEPVLVAYVPELLTVGGHVARVLDALPAQVFALPVSERVLASVGDTRTTQGLLAGFNVPDHRSQPVAAAPGLSLVLDRVRDPGNVGTLLRSAAAAGAGMVLLSPECADPFSPKVVRASAGAIFSVPFRVLTWEYLMQILSLEYRVYATHAEADVPYYEADLTEPCAILIGNEADGLGEQARVLATRSISIPMAAGMESLNAAVAGSVLLFEARRQRTRHENGAFHVPA